jgi:hypothetical protein
MIDSQEKDEGRRMKDEEIQHGASDSSFILHPSSFSSTACRVGRTGAGDRPSSVHEPRSPIATKLKLSLHEGKLKP